MNQELINELQALLDAKGGSENFGFMAIKQSQRPFIAKLVTHAPALLEAAKENLIMRRALSKVPLFRMTEDALGWECCGCGAVAGITENGEDRNEPCKPGCYVAIVEDALALGKETV